MRVIAGEAKGRKLRTVPSSHVRPITDRVKESLFNIIGPDIQGATFLDLFAGTGSVGIEALSRGGEWVQFVDRDRRAVDTVHANLKLTGMHDRARVLRADSFSFLQGPVDRVFHYVYIAPPQYRGLWSRALREVDAQPEWLADDAWVIAQIHPTEYEDQPLENLVLFDRRQYGSTLLVFYRRKLGDHG